MPASFVWQPGPTGGTPTNAANLNKLAVVADIGTPGTPTGDALKAAIGTEVAAQVAAQNLATQTDAAGLALVFSMIGL